MALTDTRLRTLKREAFRNQSFTGNAVELHCGRVSKIDRDMPCGGRENCETLTQEASTFLAGGRLTASFGNGTTTSVRGALAVTLALRGDFEPFLPFIALPSTPRGRRLAQ